MGFVWIGPVGATMTPPPQAQVLHVYAQQLEQPWQP
jgi:hypothetical protein